MRLLKASAYTTSTVIAGMAVGLISQKVYAVLTGPEGVAMIGNLTNFLSVAYVLAAGGIGSGIVKYVAEYRANPVRMNQILQSTARFTLICCLLVSLLLILFSSPLSRIIFGTEDFAQVISMLAAVITFVILNQWIQSVLSGLGLIRQYAVHTLILHSMNLILTLALGFTFGLPGLLIALFLPAALTFFIGFIVFRKNLSIRWTKPVLAEFLLIRRMLTYAGVTILTLFLMPLAFLVLREYIIEVESANAAGQWQAVNNLSRAYNAMALSLISIYFFPAIASLKEKSLVVREASKFLKYLVLFLVPSLAFIYFLRIPILQLVYTDSFLPAEGLFGFWLLGDLFRILSITFSYILLARRRLRFYIVLELVFTLLFILSGIIFIHQSGVTGITYAYALTYSLCLGVLLLAWKQGKAFGL